MAKYIACVKEFIENKYNKVPVAIRATFWFVFCATLQKCVAFITTPIFTRLLTTEQYGQFTTYNSWMSTFVMFTSFNLSAAVYNKGLTKYSNDKDGYMSAMMGTTSMITALCFCIYLIFQRFICEMTELPGEIISLMFVEMFFFQSFSFWTVRQRYDYRYKSVVIVTVLMAILNAVLGVIAVIVSTEKGMARIVTHAVVNTLFGIVIYIHIFRRGKKFFKWEYARFAILFNIPLIPHYLSTYILDQADRIMIQKMCGVSFVGIYSVAYSLGMVMKIITAGISQALTPWQYRKLEEKDFGSINKNISTIMLFVSSILIAFMAVAPEMMKLLAGSEYYEAVYIVPSITASIFFLLLYNLYSNVEFYYDANKFTMFASITGAALNVILNYIFIGMFGYIMAGYTTLFCYIVFTFAHFMYAQYVAQKQVGCKVFDYKPVLLISLILVMACALLTMLYKTFVIRYLIFAALCIVIVMKRKIIVSRITQMRGR